MNLPAEPVLVRGFRKWPVISLRWKEVICQMYLESDKAYQKAVSWLQRWSAVLWEVHWRFLFVHSNKGTVQLRERPRSKLMSTCRSSFPSCGTKALRSSRSWPPSHRWTGCGLCRLSLLSEWSSHGQAGPYDEPLDGCVPMATIGHHSSLEAREMGT